MAELPSGTVTFLFTDLEVSTRLWEEEADAMRVALARHDEILRAVVALFDGYLVKGRGDGVHAAFVTADDALAAAVEAQRVLGDEDWAVSAPLRARMGLHTGSAQLRDGDYFGSSVNRAARLMAVAHGGQVVCSRPTADLAGDALPEGCSLIDLGEHRLRDLLRPEQVFEVRTPGTRTSFPPLQSLDSFPGNLPLQLTSFVGRDDDVAGVAKALNESRLVTLTGVGGVGKTRLALQVAADVLPQFADGAWLCELAATNDADLLAQVVVAALAVQSRPGRSLAESVCDYLAGKQALIVLDNCEHLLDEAAEMAEAILRAAPGVRILATSREALGVPGERLLGVPSLDVASESTLEAIAGCEAVRLFMDRAGATRSGLELDATNADAIVEICRRLDAIPLAIELAAARVTSMSPAEIAGLLDERFRLLTGGRRRGVERHQTLRATVDWSYSLLDERERTVFVRLGVFAGSFDADAATAVAGDDELAAWDVRDALDDLVAKSMVVLDDGPDATMRYRLLETLRQYALEGLDDTARAEEHRRRHAEHYAAFAEASGLGLEGPDEAVWFPRFDAELDNLRAAVAWALEADDPSDGELGLRIIAPLTMQEAWRPSTGVGEWAEAAVARAETSTPARRCAVLAAAALKAGYDGDVGLERARAVAALRDGLPADTPAPATAYIALAVADSLAGHDEAALRILAEGHRALDAIGADDSAHIALMGLDAQVHLYAGQVDDARALAEDALARARRLGNPSWIMAHLRWFAWTRRPDESNDTIAALEECLAHSRAVATPDSAAVVHVLGLLAKLRSGRGEPIPAIEALRDAVVRAHNTGQKSFLFGGVLSYAVGVAADLDAWEFAATLGAAVTDGPLAEPEWVAPPERADRRATLDHAREQLGPDRYESAHAIGTAMSYEELVAYTLAELDRLLAAAADG